MTVVLLLCSTLLLTQQATPPRDKPVAPRPAAGGVVRGRVTALATREPLHRVRVTLNGPTQPLPVGVTDTRGEFEIVNVPPGTYTVTATRLGFLTTAFGQRRPGEGGRAVAVTAGETVAGVDFALPRGGVLAGRISDEAGTEYPGVRVEAVEMRYVRGRRILVQSAAALTDDLGEFRLSGLQPGSYFLRASTMDTWEGLENTGTFAFTPTYFPGVTGANEAGPLDLTLGQEIANLDFALRPGRTARVSGVLKDASDQPLAGQLVNLSVITRGVGGSLVSSGPGPSTRTDAGGAFEAAGLAPGEYLVSAGGGNDTVMTTVVVGDGDDRTVVLSPRKPTPVSGAIVTASGEAPPFLPNRLRVIPVAADPESFLPSWEAPRDVAVAPEWTFTFSNLTGQYLFRVSGLPDDWVVARVVANGRDVTDTPVTVASGTPLKGVQLVLSDETATVAGRVLDAAGQPMPDSTVVIFATDPSKWSLASRHIRTARPDGEGRFFVAGLIPGTYRAIAQEFVIDGQWEDPAFLKSLIGRANPVEARPAQTTTVTLRLEGPR